MGARRLASAVLQQTHPARPLKGPRTRRTRPIGTSLSHHEPESIRAVSNRTIRKGQRIGSDHGGIALRVGPGPPLPEGLGRRRQPCRRNATWSRPSRVPLGRTKVCPQGPQVCVTRLPERDKGGNSRMSTRRGGGGRRRGPRSSVVASGLLRSFTGRRNRGLARPIRRAI